MLTAVCLLWPARPTETMPPKHFEVSAGDVIVSFDVRAARPGVESSFTG